MMPSPNSDKPPADQAPTRKRELQTPPARPVAPPFIADGLEAVRGSDC